MKAIVYRCSRSIVPNNTHSSVPISGRMCHVFSNSLNSPRQKELQNDALRQKVKRGNLKDDIVLFLPPDNDEMLTLIKDFFLELFGRQPIISKYDDSHLGGHEEANVIKEEIAKLGGNNISPSQITFVETIKEYDMYEELQTLLDGITQDEYNEVDAIFVTLTTDAQDPFLVQSGTQNQNRQVNIKSYGGQIGRFEELRKKMDPSGVGLKGATFHFKKGVTSIARLGEKRPLYVFFVSTADHALADVDFVKQTHLPEIEKHLKNLKRID